MFKKIHLTVFVIFTVCFSFLNLMGQKANRISIETTYISEKPVQEKGISNYNGRAELMPGFPVNLGYPLNNPPTVFDINGDEFLEILQSRGNYVWAINYDGTILENWPFGDNEYNDATGPAVADINSDDINEIAVKLYGKDLWALTPEAVPLDGFPYLYESVSSSTFGSTLVLAQMDDNPDDLEIIVPFGVKYFEQTGTWNEAGIFVVDNQGNALEGFPYIFYDESSCIHICVADIDDDDENEIIGCNLYGSGAQATGALYVFERDGSIKPGFPIEADSWIMWASITDLDNDGFLEIFASSLDKKLYGFHHDGTPVSGFPVACSQMLWGLPVPGDIDGDGDIEIIVAGENKMYAFHHDGSIVQGWPVSGANYVNQFPLIADIDGDNAGEIFLAFANNIYVYNGSGEMMEGFPITVENDVKAAMLVTDIDLDGDMELLASSGYPGNNMYLWDLEYAYNEESIQWGMFGQNPQHTGLFLLDEGTGISQDEKTPSGYSTSNYPNPFNSSTTISFSVPKKSLFVNLEIHNSTGQKIRTLVNKKLNAGKYQAVWDGTDDSGKAVGSGIYFYQLKTGNNFSKTKKMLFLK